jgi:hypothetical protein
MLAALFWIFGGLGGLVGVVGLAAAFAVAQAVLFVLATVAPILAVLAAVPQMRWLRGLWLKAVAVLALLPVAAGGIFKAGVILSYFFSGGGLSELLIRLFWLWGAVGFMLSLAGILGKMTLSTAVESTARVGRGVRDIVATAAGAAMGSPAASAGAAVANEISTPARTGAAAVAFEGGLTAPQYERGSAGGLEQATPHGSEPIRDPAERMSSYFKAAGLDLEEFRTRSPEAFAAVAAVFDQQSETISGSPDPLAEAARLAGVDFTSAWPGGEDLG